MSDSCDRQEYWNGLPFPSPGDRPDPGIEPRSPALQADFVTIRAMRESLYVCVCACVCVYIYIHIYMYIYVYIYICIYICIFFSIMFYHKILNIEPCCLSVLYSQSIPPPPSSLLTAYINLDNPISNRPLCPLQSLEMNLFDSH